MKKQTKTTKKVKLQKTTPVRKEVVVVHNRWQRFWGIVALVGLFLCGLFVGMSIKSNTISKVTNQEAVVQSTEENTNVAEPQNVCNEIERLLMQKLPDETDDVDDRIDRAKIFATLAERGCPENSASFVEHARLELEIARAIEDDEFDHEETIEVVETYKRLHMQAAAEEIFEKAKKLTNPAIDFILQVEKIINE